MGTTACDDTAWRHCERESKQLFAALDTRQWFPVQQYLAHMFRGASLTDWQRFLTMFKKSFRSPFRNLSEPTYLKKAQNWYIGVYCYNFLYTFAYCNLAPLQYLTPFKVFRWQALFLHKTWHNMLKYSNKLQFINFAQIWMSWQVFWYETVCTEYLLIMNRYGLVAMTERGLYGKGNSLPCASTLK